MIYWTAGNNSSYLNGYRTAKTMIGAVRAARSYLNNELYGEGTIRYWRNDPIESEPCRIDSKTIFTNYRWVIEER